ncbi:MAG: YdcF family protein [Bryobacteraceae bacterium]
MPRAVRKLSILLVAATAAALLYVSWKIGRQSTRDEAQPADVIIVLGAAEYRGRPSPVLRARLDHALELFHRKLAPRLLTTGGAGGDPDYTEGGVGRNYLVERNVPSEVIIVEPEGETTAHSTAAAGEIMHRMGLKSCILVSDGYHIFRAKRMLESSGITVYGSPRPSAVAPGRWEQWWLYLRQAVGYVLWRVGVSV